MTTPISDTLRLMIEQYERDTGREPEAIMIGVYTLHSLAEEDLMCDLSVDYNRNPLFQFMGIPLEYTHYRYGMSLSEN